MKIKADAYVIHKIDSEILVIPIGEESDRTKGILKLTESGCFLWEQLQNEISETELVKALTDEYDVDDATAIADVDEFIQKINALGCLE